ncbi:uncharacterized protein [Procambarus clarkii]|uniref:uncharacterized protein n=1 Tax=Procambarus clarkii TaxID=6728 RepID=UPI001E678372|nr:uncharacterized protein LOC123775017 [Procambarus clarkii]
MSKPGSPQIRAPKPVFPGNYRSGPAGPVFQDVQKYKLNQSGRPDSRLDGLSSGTHQAQKLRKIGRFQRWTQLNPYKFHFTAVGLGLLLFFNKPIYDFFLNEGKEGPRVKGERGYRG